jgi:sulfite exporter TauE/SafE
MHLFAEAALLGLASGPGCLASCGPVLLPALAAQGKGLRGTAGLLSVFLSGRLAGYRSFSVLAWAAGLAAALAVYALAARHCPPTRGPSSSPSRLVSIERRVRPWGPAALGLLTGLNICPPFLAAGARAAQTRSLPGAAAFFLVFFLGTAAWSLPLVAMGWLRRLAAVAAVARITLLILAGWYAYLGIIALSWRFSHA